MSVVASQLVGEISIKGGSESIKILAQVGEQSDTSQKGLNQLKNQSESTGSSFAGRLTGGIRTAIGGFLDFGARLGQTVFGFQTLGQTLVGLAGKILAPNASMEQTTTAFEQLLGGAKAANKEITSLSKMAADTPFEFPDLANSEQQLIAFQIPLKKTHPLLLAIGDALSGLGKNTPATLDQVVQVFGQMNAAGKLQTQDLMQLTSVGINGFQILATQMHKPVAVIKQMVTDGTIPASKGIELLRRGMEKTFGGGMAAQAKTFNGLLSTFQDNIGAAWRTFAGPLFDKAKVGLQKLGDLVSSKAFQDFAKTLSEKIATGASKVGDFFQQNVVPAVQHFIDFIKSPEVGTFVGKLQDLGGTVKDTVLNAFNDLKPVVEGLFNFIHDTAIPALSGLADGLNTSINYVRQHKIEFGIAAGVLTTAFIPAIIKSGVESVIAGTKTATSFIPQLIKTGIEGWKAAGKLAIWVGNAIKTGVEATIAGGKIAAQFIGNVVKSGTEAVISGGKIAASFVANIVKSGAEAVIAGAKITAQFVASVAKAGIQAVITGGQFLASLIPSVISFTGAAIAAAVTAIPAVLAGFGAWIVGALGVAAANIAAFWPIYLAIAVIVGVIALVVLAVKNWGAIVEWLKGVWNAVIAFFQGVFAKIGLAFSALGAVAHAVWDRIVSIFGNVGNWFHDRWNDAVNRVKGVLNGLKDFAQGVWNGITGGLKGAFNGVIGFINGAIDAVNNVTGKVGIPPIPHIPLLARGTSFFQGGPAVVGEGSEPELVIGPHLVNMPRGSRVVPISQLQGGSQTIVVNVAPAAIELDGYRFAGKMMPHMVNQLRGRGITI